MRLIVNEPAVIKTYLVQGTLDIFQPDKALSNVLSRIGKSGFDKLDVPDAFRQGLKFYLENSGYLYNNKLTPEGQKIVETGSLWKTLQGRFVVSILICNDKQYLWSCSPLVDDYRDRILTDSNDSIELLDAYSVDGRQYRNFDFGRVRKLIETRQTKVRIVYEYPSRSVSYECENRKFSNPGNFELLYDFIADEILKNLVRKYDFLTAEEGALKCYKVSGPVNESVLRNILIKKDCHLEPVEDGPARLEDISFELSSSDVVDRLFAQYICICSENEYCPRHYIPSLFSDFSSIFDDICERGTDFSSLFNRALKESTGRARLRLQACLDLDSESDQDNAAIVDLDGKSISMDDLVKSMVGLHKNIQSVSCISKFITINVRIAHNTALFGDAVKKKCGVPLTVITCSFSSRKATDEKRRAFEEFAASDNIILKYASEADMLSIHDRYYRIVTDSEIIWFKMTNELEALQFNIENPSTSTLSSVKELTLIKKTDEQILKSVKHVVEVSK